MIFGEFLMETGRIPDGLAQYQQAVALVPQSLEMQTQLAEAYLKAGRPADAIERYNAAIMVARAAGRTDAIQPLLDSIKKCRARAGNKR
jgi:predicted Zn-dependent protease